MTGQAEPRRYYALDSVRATAMLLGVVYHALLLRGYVGEYPQGSTSHLDPSRWVESWLHCFRMPLFFVISGFFGCMMLEKYGIPSYLRRRWSRIGVPLLVGMFTVSPAFVLAGAMVARWIGSHAGSIAASGEAPSRADPDQPWPGTALGARLFGPYAQLFQLNHLWFLWYLLVFVTAAPWLTKGLVWILPLPLRRTADRLARWAVVPRLAPISLALIAALALLPTWSPHGWGLGLPTATHLAFPDFVLSLDPDMAFYFLFFLWGWALYGQREVLPALARAWAGNLLLGLGAFTAATLLSDTYDGSTSIPQHGLVRWAGYTLYCLGSGSTAIGILGGFLRYLDKPSRTWRYLADTALWVYMVHQPLVLIGLTLVRPLHLSWWLQTALVSALTAAVALLAYEVIVRPTPLVRIFGPARPPRPRSARSDQKVVESVQP
jgi:glucan biosynthesis protein C